VVFVFTRRDVESRVALRQEWLEGSTNNTGSRMPIAKDVETGGMRSTCQQVMFHFESLVDRNTQRNSTVPLSITISSMGAAWYSRFANLDTPTVRHFANGFMHDARISERRLCNELVLGHSLKTRSDRR
jgi:hypothetical protein